MGTDWDENIYSFIRLANTHGVRMIMVGSEAMNYYGYSNSVTEVDFWIEATSKNINNIVLALKELGSKLVEFHIPLLNRKRNVLIEFAPALNLGLITTFVIDKSFSWAYDDSIETSLQENSSIKFRVLALEDLIDSKAKSRDSQDLLDLQELKKIHDE